MALVLPWHSLMPDSGGHTASLPSVCIVHDLAIHTAIEGLLCIANPCCVVGAG